MDIETARKFIADFFYYLRRGFDILPALKDGDSLNRGYMSVAAK